MNCRYNSKSIECNIQEWPVPETGILQLDYVSSKRVPKEAKAQRDEVLPYQPPFPFLPEPDLH